jgi:hypothetical protein
MGITLDPEQHKVLTEAYHEARNLGATAREQKALTEALLVESHIRNLSGGDRDSRGPLQQRPSQGWMHPNNVKLAVRDFLTHARANKGIQGSAGKLAQSVQRSAFPARYDEQADVANSLLRHYGNGSRYIGSMSSSGADPASTTLPGQIRTQTTIEDDPQAIRRVALANLLQKHNPNSLLLKLGVVDPNEPITKSVQHSIVGGQATNQASGGKLGNPPQGHRLLTHPGISHGVADFEGTKVAAWIKPALEYARKHGWKGQVNSGWRSRAEQEHIYNSGVRPAAKPGTSNHEFTAFPGGAVDASDAEQLSHILRSSPYAKLLVWAGSKDPVHFSHPHNGSY